jgi:hypothetical protein
MICKIRNFGLVAIAFAAATLGGCSLSGWHQSASTVQAVTQSPPPANATPEEISANQAVHAFVDSVPYGSPFLALLAAGASIVAGVTSIRHGRTKQVLSEVASKLTPEQSKSLSVNAQRKINEISS